MILPGGGLALDWINITRVKMYYYPGIICSWFWTLHGANGQCANHRIATERSQRIATADKLVGLVSARPAICLGDIVSVC